MTLFRKTLPFFLMALLLLMAGCAASTPRATDAGTPDGAPPSAQVKQTPAVSRTDASLFQEGLKHLAGTPPEGTPDYTGAQIAFVTLIKNYPQSKWSPLSEAYIHLIAETQNCREQSVTNQRLADAIQTDNARISRDNEQLRKEVRAQGERLNALAQENEQLKRDIQSLKDLELQMQKRDRSFR